MGWLLAEAAAHLQRLGDGLEVRRPNPLESTRSGAKTKGFLVHHATALTLRLEPVLIGSSASAPARGVSAQS